MAGNHNSSNSGKKKGFAGLSSMVSDVDAVIADASTPTPRSARESIGNTGTTPPNAEPKPAPREPNYNTPESTGFSSETKTLIGFGVVVAVIIATIAAMDDRKPTSASQTPDFTATPSTTTSTQPAPRPAAPSRPTEQKPPVGRNNVLAGAQLRYCVAEQIRVDAAEKVVDNYIEAHVDRFNVMVGDYNSRCGEFRYREGSLQSAERAMEPYRAQLEQEGRGSILRSGTTGSTQSIGAGQFVPDIQRQKPPPDPIVRAIQRRLNHLGYNAGTPDGYSGQRTVDAIQEFQRSRGLTPDGRPTELLLLQLNVSEPSDPARRNSAGSNASAFASMPQSPSAPAFTKPATTLDKPSRPTFQSNDLSRATPAERSQIESACNYERQHRGPAEYNACIRTELGKLSAFNGKPDLTLASPSERNSIESACNYERQHRGPGDYYGCLNTELRKLRTIPSKPDLSSATRWEQASIESTCNYERQHHGPGDYYGCLRKELAKLSANPSKPDISSASSWEQQSIENSCNYERQNRGPADYYACVGKEFRNLRAYQGKPDLTRVAYAEQNAIENACNYEKRNRGPADYYGCLRTELAKLGVQ